MCAARTANQTTDTMLPHLDIDFYTQTNWQRKKNYQRGLQNVAFPLRK